MTTTQNLVRGVFGPVGNNTNWSNYTVVNLVPFGALPDHQHNHRLLLDSRLEPNGRRQYGCLHDSARQLDHQRGYTRYARRHLQSSIVLSNVFVCPVAPSTTTPCIVRFDPRRSHFAGERLLLCGGFRERHQQYDHRWCTANPPQSSLRELLWGDQTRLTVGQSIPGHTYGGTTFLMYVMNN